MKRIRVAYVFPISHKFRLSFHERLRALLSERCVEYDYIYTDADPLKKGDTASVPWGTRTRLLSITIGPVKLSYQAAFRASYGADLVILQQENGLLANYPIQIIRRLVGKRVAFFGHGRNFQASNPKSAGERFKRFWIDKVDWWFAYTERSADIVASAGFPRSRITVFNNAIDTGTIARQLAEVSESQMESLRRAEFQGSDNIAVYIGGLYDLKRIAFLLQAAEAIRVRVPDFQLLVIGGGPDLPLIERAAQKHPWIHALGPRFGAEKTLLASLARVFMMPGLVGLGVLDSFAYGTPMVTTDQPYHSPEIDYLKDGVNGVIVADGDSVEAYAAAVERVLVDDAWRERLRAGAAEALDTYTIEAMAQRFADGVIKALDD